MIYDMERGWFRGKDQPLWHNKVYHMWKNMWSRVTNVNHPSYEYYKDCKIHEDFKYLSKYVEWIEAQPNFQDFCNTCDTIRWCVDKDAKYPGNNFYYPEYMSLTTQSENSKEMLARKGRPKSRRTSVIAIKHDSIILLKSIKEGKPFGFNSRYIGECINKKRKIYKGYKWYRINYKHNKIYRRS